ncbi:unnamed protein product, partial [Sphacelaria rigidula]
MTGMMIAGCCSPTEVVLTDYAPRVLANLRFNEEMNRSKLGARRRTNRNSIPTIVSVRSLDWNDYVSKPGLADDPVEEKKSPLQPPANGHAETRNDPNRHNYSELTRNTPTREQFLAEARVSAAAETGQSCPTGGNSECGGSHGQPVDTSGKTDSGGSCDHSEDAEARAELEQDSLGAPDVLLAADVVYDAR